MSQKKLVYKSNELIEGQYHLSSIAQKIAASTISLVNPNEKEIPLPIFEWSLSELSEISGIRQDVLRKKLSFYTKELVSLTIELKEFGSNSFRQLGLFREFQYNDKKKVLNIEFENRLEEYIRNFSGNFTRYQLSQIQKLNSGYSIRIYEILRMSHNLSKKVSEVSFYEASISDIKAMLGVKPKAYTGRFNNFRTYVLEVAKKELEEKTDLKFDYQAIRKGRAIETIKFIIRHNKKVAGGDINSTEMSVLELSIEEKIQQYFPPNILNLVLSEFDTDRIERNLQYTIEQQELSTTHIEHVGKYLLKAIKEDYARPSQTKSTIDKLLDTSWDV